ncbi:hypothetical protein GGI00_006183 [Coemansia sp. RSA 2681]|nr:hypothetical protein GGI00_006183 [Coemansia sp. RSA 2681]
MSTGGHPTVLPPLSVAIQQQSLSPSSMQLSLSPIRPSSTDETCNGVHNALAPSVGAGYDVAVPYCYDRRYEPPTAPREPHLWPFASHPASANFQTEPPPGYATNAHSFRQQPRALASATVSPPRIAEPDTVCDIILKEVS